MSLGVIEKGSFQKVAVRQAPGAVCLSYMKPFSVFLYWVSFVAILLGLDWIGLDIFLGDFSEDHNKRLLYE